MKLNVINGLTIIFTCLGTINCFLDSHFRGNDKERGRAYPNLSYPRKRSNFDHSTNPSRVSSRMSYFCYETLNKKLMVLVFLCSFLWVCSVPHQAEALLADRIAAVVNLELILLSDIQERLLPEQKKDSGAVLNALNQLIDQKLQVQAARKRGISVSENEIHQAIEETRLRNGLTNDEAFKRSLQKETLTLEKISEEIKTQLLLKKLFQREVLPDVLIKDEELKPYYQKHPEFYKIPEERKMTQILFKYPQDAHPADKEKIRGEADFIFGKLQEGKSIEQVIEENRETSQNFVRSELGSFKKGELLPALDEAAYSLEPERWSKPIETESGIHLLRVDQKSSAIRPFEEVSQEIKERLFQERSESAMREWMVNLRKSATIELPLLKDHSFNNQGTLR